LSDIFGVMQKPEWWFSTILVAVIANVAANYIYEALRVHFAGLWPQIFDAITMTFMMGLLMWCSWVLPVPPQLRILIFTSCILGFGGALLVAFGFIREPLRGGSSLMQLSTMAALSMLIFREPNFSHAWEMKDTTWFASQIFTMLIISFFITGMVGLVLIRRHVKKRQRMK
jgi:hypothetical protein